MPGSKQTIKGRPTMNTTTHIAITAAVTALFTLAQADARQDPTLTMKPMQGLSFDLGSDHAVTYYLKDSGRCRIVMTAAGAPEESNGSFTATRFEATIEAGRTTRYVSNDGQAIEFDCEPSAGMVSIRAIEQDSASAGR
jgi:hypothetical protein